MTETSLFLKLADDLEMEFVLIPSGIFLMRSSDGEVEAAFIEAQRYSPNAKRDWISCEQPCHQATISHPFYLGKFPMARCRKKSIPEKPRPSEASLRIPGGCMTCTAMSGNGVRIGFAPLMITRLWTVAPGKPGLANRHG